VLLFIGLCILASYFIVAILALDVVFGSGQTGYEFIVFIGVLFAVIAIIPVGLLLDHLFDVFMSFIDFVAKLLFQFGKIDQDK